MNQIRREVNDADLLILLCPISRNKHTSLHHLVKTVVDRSVAGKEYMDGGGLGMVTVGVDGGGDVDPRVTLNISQSVDKVMDNLMKILMVQVLSHNTITESPLLRLEVEYDKCGCR